MEQNELPTINADDDEEIVTIPPLDSVEAIDLDEKQILALTLSTCDWDEKKSRAFIDEHAVEVASCIHGRRWSQLFHYGTQPTWRTRRKGAAQASALFDERFSILYPSHVLSCKVKFAAANPKKWADVTMKAWNDMEKAGLKVKGMRKRRVRIQMRYAWEGNLWWFCPDSVRIEII